MRPVALANDGGASTVQLTPSQAYAHIKESLVEYLEAAYRISHPAVAAERASLLRQVGTVAQIPFVEATPAFPTQNFLRDLEATHPDHVPAGLADLVNHGVPVHSFALYKHQQEALLSALSSNPNVLVASGTGSGKTEAFLLPILASLVREAAAWSAPSAMLGPGEWSPAQNAWLHSRRHETRPAAVRAIVLYPMNALVNDQLQRLRRILSRGTSPEWQRAHFNNNLIHFGMYTGLSKPAGSPKDSWRRDRVRAYLDDIRRDWEELSEELRNTGTWPRPESSEMLCRWDMQLAPPDILVTNYSMLEYMMVRPIESSIFDATREWLKSTPSAQLTLVVDEAHTYTGAKGTEVAHLIRRLKDRLELDTNSPKFRAIATSASIPDVPGADSKIREFVADLFGEGADGFSVVRVDPPPPLTPRESTEPAAQAYARFHDDFDVQNPTPSITTLASHLGNRIDPTESPDVALYRLLADDLTVIWVRTRTARKATQLDVLARECWPDVPDVNLRDRALAGVLAAGSFARPQSTPDVPPLISMRLHGFFRGITGLWACMDPQCSSVSDRGPGPVGKLYTDPRPWCGCGARVLEVFSCRKCGLLFLGGIPADHDGGLWPWSDDLSGAGESLAQFRIFGVEAPNENATPEWRSTRTTLGIHRNDPYARPVYETEAATEKGHEVSPYPGQCPRCHNYRAPGPLGSGREVIEPLRTIGPRSFAALIEDAFRVQPRAPKSHPDNPNRGRKALLFSDSRQQAARLAGDMRETHRLDLVRQLLYLALHSCDQCEGTGTIERQPETVVLGDASPPEYAPCPACGGSGAMEPSQALNFAELRKRVISIQDNRRINPDPDHYLDLFQRANEGDAEVIQQAERAFELDLRREISEEEFSLEHLGLASWQIEVPSDVQGSFDPLTNAETLLFIRSVARILATENILLPPKPREPWAWQNDLKPYESNVIIPGSGRVGNAIPYNLQPRRKLGRYVIAAANALQLNGRLPDTTPQQWVNGLHWKLWNALKQLKVLQPAGRKINNETPFGIRVDSFVLAPLGETVARCKSCGYVMSEALLSVCLRCGQETSPVNPNELRNYYRRSATYVLPGQPFDDPNPFLVHEHTAQIGGNEARQLERWFQDFFRDDETPADKRVDVLSVTTTMEMGIDIGSLLEVGLRNVPPTVANYQQRAGRAGRRGSSLATVLTYAQHRSHDQYYFDRPPEIVSSPPRVPELYIENPVIARRHVRALVLHAFFHGEATNRGGANLFATWGNVSEYLNHGDPDKLRLYVADNKDVLLKHAARIVSPRLIPDLPGWLDAIESEVTEVAETALQPTAELFELLVTDGLLPKYAFPVDVVTLVIPNDGDDDEEGQDALQRDLKIALAEYAPGSEVVRGVHPTTWVYKSQALYDPFNRQPSYLPDGVFIECQKCRAIKLAPFGTVEDECETCGSFEVVSVPYIRPRGFSVDQALLDGGRRRYQGGGTEQAGATTPARLMVGVTSFEVGQPCAQADRLLAHVHVGDLFVVNKGQDSAQPGFLICPACGRAIDPDAPGTHKYPASVPPHFGHRRGPRAGTLCMNTTDFRNVVVLGHRFRSEVVLLGADIPLDLDAPFTRPHGAAIWYSFGTLLSNAAARYLQLDPGELRVGVRPVRRGNTIHGEVFLYDDVPGGAGYARAIERDLPGILTKALDLGEHCFNPDCGGACYRCLLDYGNQGLHRFLDRELGASLLRYLLRGEMPLLDETRVRRAVQALVEYLPPKWSSETGNKLVGTPYSVILRDSHGQQFGLWVLHPLSARPVPDEINRVLAATGVRPAIHNLFDTERRPFWVVNNLIT